MSTPADFTLSGNIRKLRPLKRLGHGRVQAQWGEKNCLVDFSSNDYLALSEHPSLIAESRRFLEMYGTGSGAARLMSGDLDIFHQLEDEVARFKEQDAALIFNSGYAANTGIIPALVGRNDVVFADRLDHASIYDGIQLSGAHLVRFRHNDVNHLADCLKKKRGTGRALIAVESIYSMDGDRSPLQDLVSLKEQYDCLLMVDEAHAVGLYGENGGGLVQEGRLADKVDIVMGTFGKALGSYGAFAAGSRELKEHLINRARSFIFSTALPPAVVGANLAALKVVTEQPELRKDLHEKVALFRGLLQENGISLDSESSQIIPLLIGDSERALGMAQQLEKQGVFAIAIRPPTVPEGTSRLRMSVTGHHSMETLRDTASAVARIWTTVFP